MKQNPLYQKAFKNMAPGAITQSGFLGDDTRPLSDIIQHDEELMRNLDLDFDTMIKQMRHLLEEGMKGLGEPVEIDGTWLVQVYEARGHLVSPYEDGIFRKINTVVKNIKKEKSILYSELSLHLIEVHHFFQGRGSPYRIEPADIKDVLEL